MAEKKLEIWEDTWVNTQCGRCFSNCAIRVRRINGVAVAIEGDSSSWQGAHGGLCARGVSGLQALYDPNRLNVPLKRTNPDKGYRVDPKWKEISWDEALEEITEKLKQVLEDDPRKILFQSGTMKAPTAALGWRRPIMNILGTPNGTVGGGGIACGNGIHFGCGLLHGTWDVLPDYRYCNYAIYWGVHNGHATGHAAMVSARLVAEAMERGMKLVVFDPMSTYSSDKATEWIALIPGTDAAVALAMCNVIVNELGMFDSAYLKNKTNSPYLVDILGHYIRDTETNKPLVWDTGESRAKVYDNESIIDFALEGIYKVNGVEYTPCFQVIKNHLKTYTPEMASEISDVPAEVIRRIATEFAYAAQIGSNIVINKHKLPFRPVASVTMRGAEAHENSANTVLALLLLNHIVGACEVPGGAIGLPNTCLGYPETGNWKFGVEKGLDGLMTIAKAEKSWFTGHLPWPINDPKTPTDAGLTDLFTLCTYSPIWVTADREDIWQKIKLPYRIEMMFNFGCNSVMSVPNPEKYAEFLKNMKFIVSWDIVANEFAEGFADILLPDTSYLETFTWMDGQGYFFNYPYGMDPWCCSITQPVVKPQHKRRYIVDVWFEILNRLGKQSELNEYWNRYIGLDEADKFKPTDKVTWEQVGDKALKHYFGSAHGLEWFKEKGPLVWPKKVEEAYWRCFKDIRVPIYLEFMIDLRNKIKLIGEELGIEFNWSQYSPLISWFPCSFHRINESKHDLYCYCYRDIIHTGTCTMQQPWLDEASKMNPYTYNITINPTTAKQKGFKDGDFVEIESSYGRKVQGVLKIRIGQHPKTVALVSAEHWAKGQPIAKGKGTRFFDILEQKFEQCDPLTLNIENCVRVNLTRVEGK